MPSGPRLRFPWWPVGGNFQDRQRYLPSQILFESSFQVDSLALGLVSYSEHSGQQFQIDELEQIVARPVDTSVDAILVLSLPDVAGQVSNGDSHRRNKRVPCESVLGLLLEGLIAVGVGLLTVGVNINSGVNLMLSTLGNPAQIDDEFSVDSHGFVGFFLPDIGLGVDHVDHEGGQDEVALLTSSVSLDKESTVFDDSVDVDSFAVP